MILLVRLDERLLHGQVAARLLKSLDVDTVVVADDPSAASKIATQALLMAVTGAGLSTKIKTSVKDTLTAVRLLKDPRCDPKKIVIIVRELQTLLKIAREVPGVSKINIGNYGNLVESDVPRKRIAKELSVNPKEAMLLKELIQTGKNIYAQMTPDSSRLDAQELLNKLYESIPSLKEEKVYKEGEG